MHPALQLLYDGSDAEAVALLSGIAPVRLLHLHDPWARPEEQAKYELYSRQARQWGGQPGNYELMVKQGGLFFRKFPMQQRHWQS